MQDYATEIVFGPADIRVMSAPSVGPTRRASLDPLAAFRAKNRMEEPRDYRLIDEPVAFLNAPTEPDSSRDFLLFE